MNAASIWRCRVSAALSLCAAFAVAPPDPAAAKPRIKPPRAVYFVQGPESRGGSVRLFLDSIALFRRTKVKVVLKGECLSACTLYTSLLRDGLVCARPGTKLVFHEFVRIRDIVAEGGVLSSFQVIGPVEGELWNRLWQTYPSVVRTLITNRFPKGRLPPHGHEIAIPARQVLPICKLD